LLEVFSNNKEIDSPRIALIGVIAGALGGAVRALGVAIRDQGSAIGHLPVYGAVFGLFPGTYCWIISHGPIIRAVDAGCSDDIISRILTIESQYGGALAALLGVIFGLVAQEMISIAVDFLNKFVAKRS
jgi:uncharacterized YccA/Bax inhibitor family protein